jgi:hypothetical protein
MFSQDVVRDFGCSNWLIVEKISIIHQGHIN